MKLNFIILLVLAILLGACASSNTGRSAQDLKDPNEIATNYNSLADYLRRVPGVMVTQRGSSYFVMVRGMSSISGSNEPLYVIDRALVEGYERAAGMVDPNEIRRVEVLKDVASTSEYGMRGANGVIVIYTNKK